MLTAAISALLVAVLSLFGVKLGVAQIAGLVIAVKVVVVGGIMGVTAKLYARKEPAPAVVAEPVESEG